MSQMSSNSLVGLIIYAEDLKHRKAFQEIALCGSLNWGHLLPSPGTLTSFFKKLLVSFSEIKGFNKLFIARLKLNRKIL